MNRIFPIAVIAGILLMILSSTVFVVDERQFAVRYALGEIREVVDEPGFYFKLPPPFQNVEYHDKRILTIDSSDTDRFVTAEKLNLDRVRTKVDNDTETIGADVVDVRLKRVDFEPNVQERVFARMQSERVRVANERRATGSAESEKIRADADRQREILLAEAYRDAQKVKGEGDAQAAAAYAKAFGADPEFAEFYRSLEAYRASFNSGGDMLVLDPTSDFFKFFGSVKGANVKGGNATSTN